jgi:hypothetical protein
MFQLERSFFKNVVQGDQYLVNGYFVYARAMSQCFQVGNLTFATVKIILLENRQGLGVLCDDISNYHFLGNHGAPHKKEKGAPWQRPVMYKLL